MPGIKVPSHYAPCADEELDYDGGSFMDGWETWQKVLCISGIVIVGGALLTGMGFGIKALCSRGGAVAAKGPTPIKGDVNEFVVKDVGRINICGPDKYNNCITINSRSIESTKIIDNYF